MYKEYLQIKYCFHNLKKSFKIENVEIKLMARDFLNDLDAWFKAMYKIMKQKNSSCNHQPHFSKIPCQNYS